MIVISSMHFDRDLPDFPHPRYCVPLRIEECGPVAQNEQIHSINIKQEKVVSLYFVSVLILIQTALMMQI